MVRAVILVAVVLLGGVRARSVQPIAPVSANDVEVPVECAARGADAVLCRVRDDGVRDAVREGRRLLSRIGFLAGLHLGGAISHSGSLSASHSLNVFGKTMNTALSVSYGPNGYYQGPGGRPPLNPIAPGFDLADDPAESSPPSSTSTSLPDKGGEVSAVLAGSISRDATRRSPGLTKTGLPKDAAASDQEAAAAPQNRLPVAEDIGGATPSGPPPHRAKVGVGAPAANPGPGTVDGEGDTPRDVEPAPVAEEVDEGDSEMVGEEPEPPQPVAPHGVQLSSERRAQLDAVARVRTPAVDEQRRLFLQHHNKHVATFNAHHAQYNGDVSRVAPFSRT